jgi:hypothetical protein
MSSATSSNRFRIELASRPCYTHGVITYETVPVGVTAIPRVGFSSIRGFPIAYAARSWLATQATAEATIPASARGRLLTMIKRADQ